MVSTNQVGMKNSICGVSNSASMIRDTMLVLADPGEPQLSMLKRLECDTTIFVGNTAEAFAGESLSARAILNWSGTLEIFREVFCKCSDVGWVHTRSAGLERSLFPELVESSVTLTNGTGVFSPSLGEFVLGAILYFAKDFRRMVRSQMAGAWDVFDTTLVSGQTVGIVGYGDIGRAIASRVKAMGMRVLAVKRNIPSGGERDPCVEQIYGPDSLLDVISQSDYIALAAPLTAETRGMIGAREFSAMKNSAVVVNVGRGPIIDEPAMLAALSSGRIKGAGLDVFDQEPLPAGHPLYSLENVLLSPHCADHTPDWLDNAMQFFVEQYGRYRRGEPLLNVVDKSLGY
jgi:phosphoglycerate dehydrogenase-like enzyme